MIVTIIIIIINIIIISIIVIVNVPDPYEDEFSAGSSCSCIRSHHWSCSLPSSCSSCGEYFFLSKHPLFSNMEWQGPCPPDWVLLPSNPNLFPSPGSPLLGLWQAGLSQVAFPFLSYLILSYLILSYLILSYLI